MTSKLLLALAFAPLLASCGSKPPPASPVFVPPPAPVCEAGKATCGGDACSVDLMTSVTSCGACGKTCGGAESCEQGECRAAAAKVVSGGSYSCALEKGVVSCWGYSGSVPIGDTPGIPRATAIPVSDVANAVDVAAGSGAACARRNDGHVACWGRNGWGATCSDDLASKDSCGARDVAGVERAKKIAVGGDRACAVLSSGKVMCWGGGSGADGVLGVSHRGATGAALVSGIEDAIDVSIGAKIACAIRASGSVVCWGEGSGPSESDSSKVFAPTAVDGLDDAASLASLGERACAIRKSGTVACWSAADHRAPAEVKGLDGAKSLALGSSICAVRGSGNVTCVKGENAPRDVPSLTDATTVSAGEGFGCATHASGTVSCWGANDGAALGNGDDAWFASPAEAEGISDAVEVTLGMGTSCIRRRSGKVSCWGAFSQGKPQDVPGLEGATHLFQGFAATCATRKKGDLMCFVPGKGAATSVKGAPDEVAPMGVPALVRKGGNVSYVSTLTGTAKSSAVPGLADAIAIHANYSSGCAIKRGGKVVCWSLPEGFSTGDRIKLTFTPIPGITDAVALYGYMGTCAIRKTGAVACWSRDDAAHPTPVAGITDAVSGDASGMGTCVVLKSGAVDCHAILQGRKIPVSYAQLSGPEQGVAGAVSAAIYDDRACAVTKEGKLLCWGSNARGALLRHEIAESDAPVDVKGLNP